MMVVWPKLVAPKHHSMWTHIMKDVLDDYIYIYIYICQYPHKGMSSIKKKKIK